MFLGWSHTCNPKNCFYSVIYFRFHLIIHFGSLEWTTNSKTIHCTQKTNSFYSCCFTRGIFMYAYYFFRIIIHNTHFVSIHLVTFAEDDESKNIRLFIWRINTLLNTDPKPIHKLLFERPGNVWFILLMQSSINSVLFLLSNYILLNYFFLLTLLRNIPLFFSSFFSPSSPQPQLTSAACTSQGLHVALGFANGDVLAASLGLFDSASPLLPSVQNMDRERTAERVREALGERGMLLFSMSDGMPQRDIPPSWAGLCCFVFFYNTT